MKEFNIINKYFAPLASNVPGAFNLQDDTALLHFPTGKKLIITADTCNEGIHFFKDDAPELIAKKALRSALSDLAAKGGIPFGYVLTLALPPYINESWLQSFANGLAADQKVFNINLIGGDTTKSNTELSISITILGTIADGFYLARSGAMVGDRIYVTGTIGDAYYGLQLLQGNKFDIAEEQRDYLINRYQVPQPRLALGQALSEFAHSAIDVSDGLVADLKHICQASNQAAIIKEDLIPRSINGKKSEFLYGGGDYEILFTAAPGESEHIESLAKRHAVKISIIGHIVSLEDDSEFVKVIDEAGKVVKLASEGYEHSW